ncbi:uncharacterized protein LOC135827298 isoform X2 [Sycon ciliatum]|uniref:uncharacterized protein LOC135827298 isoform X2 n=1 Tax=Sycon ciliatum TaxID=27933 RepID=UPI0031F65743
MASRKGMMRCTVRMLDLGARASFRYHEISVKATGQALLDSVITDLQLKEPEYFGLQLIDDATLKWLELDKPIKKQMKEGGGLRFEFRVRFYPVDPTDMFEELTRYQLVLQVRNDLLQSRLSLPEKLAAELFALVLQSELGDYEPNEHGIGYAKSNVHQFVVHQTGDLEFSAEQLHQSSFCQGMTPAESELAFLDRIRLLDMYGADVHVVEGSKGVRLTIALTPSCIRILREHQQVACFLWSKITRITYKGRKFTIRQLDRVQDEVKEKPFAFLTGSEKHCKYVWQCAVDAHAFYTTRQETGIAGAPPAAAARQAKKGGFLRNTRARLSGRKDKEKAAAAAAQHAPHPAQVSASVESQPVERTRSGRILPGSGPQPNHSNQQQQHQQHQQHHSHPSNGSRSTVDSGVALSPPPANGGNAQQIAHQQQHSDVGHPHQFHQQQQQQLQQQQQQQQQQQPAAWMQEMSAISMRSLSSDASSTPQHFRRNPHVMGSNNHSDLHHHQQQQQHHHHLQKQQHLTMSAILSESVVDSPPSFPIVQPQRHGRPTMFHDGDMMAEDTDTLRKGLPPMGAATGGGPHGTGFPPGHGTMTSAQHHASISMTSSPRHGANGGGSGGGALRRTISGGEGYSMTIASTLQNRSSAVDDVDGGISPESVRAATNHRRQRSSPPPSDHHHQHQHHHSRQSPPPIPHHSDRRYQQQRYSPDSQRHAMADSPPTQRHQHHRRHSPQQRRRSPSPRDRRYHWDDARGYHDDGRGGTTGHRYPPDEFDAPSSGRGRRDDGDRYHDDRRVGRRKSSRSPDERDRRYPRGGDAYDDRYDNNRDGRSPPRRYSGQQPHHHDNGRRDDDDHRRDSGRYHGNNGSSRGGQSGHDHRAYSRSPEPRDRAADGHRQNGHRDGTRSSCGARSNGRESPLASRGGIIDYDFRQTRDGGGGGAAFGDGHHRDATIDDRHHTNTRTTLSRENGHGGGAGGGRQRGGARSHDDRLAAHVDRRDDSSYRRDDRDATHTASRYGGQSRHRGRSPSPTDGQAHTNSEWLARQLHDESKESPLSPRKPVPGRPHAAAAAGVNAAHGHPSGSAVSDQAAGNHHQHHRRHSNHRSPGRHDHQTPGSDHGLPSPPQELINDMMLDNDLPLPPPHLLQIASSNSSVTVTNGNASGSDPQTGAVTSPRSAFGPARHQPPPVATTAAHRGKQPHGSGNNTRTNGDYAGDREDDDEPDYANLMMARQREHSAARAEARKRLTMLNTSDDSDDSGDLSDFPVGNLMGGGVGANRHRMGLGGLAHPRQPHHQQQSRTSASSSQSKPKAVPAPASRTARARSPSPPPPPPAIPTYPSKPATGGPGQGSQSRAEFSAAATTTASARETTSPPRAIAPTNTERHNASQQPSTSHRQAESVAMHRPPVPTLPMKPSVAKAEARAPPLVAKKPPPPVVAKKPPKPPLRSVLSNGGSSVLPPPTVVKAPTAQSNSSVGNATARASAKPMQPPPSKPPLFKRPSEPKLDTAATRLVDLRTTSSDNSNSTPAAAAPSSSWRPPVTNMPAAQPTPHISTSAAAKQPASYRPAAAATTASITPSMTSSSQYKSQTTTSPLVAGKGAAPSVSSSYSGMMSSAAAPTQSSSNESASYNEAENALAELQNAIFAKEEELQMAQRDLEAQFSLLTNDASSSNSSSLHRRSSAASNPATTDGGAAMGHLRQPSSLASVSVVTASSAGQHSLDSVSVGSGGRHSIGSSGVGGPTNIQRADSMASISSTLSRRQAGRQEQQKHQHEEESLSGITHVPSGLSSSHVALNPTKESKQGKQPPPAKAPKPPKKNPVDDERKQHQKEGLELVAQLRKRYQLSPQNSNGEILAAHRASSSGSTGSGTITDSQREQLAHRLSFRDGVRVTDAALSDRTLPSATSTFAQVAAPDRPAAVVDNRMRTDHAMPADTTTTLPAAHRQTQALTGSLPGAGQQRESQVIRQNMLHDLYGEDSSDEDDGDDDGADDDVGGDNYAEYTKRDTGITVHDAMALGIMASSV